MRPIPDCAGVSPIESIYGLSSRLRRVLYRTVHFQPHSGMPEGKPANTRCVQLSETNLCMIFGSPLRPKVCSGLQPSAEMCGNTRAQAMTYLLNLEALTAP